jgi:LuxR family maltose regulon positive regulatory protein
MPAPTAIPTLATKLQVPPTPGHLIERDRLFDVLDEGVKGGLVLLSAPAGAGKTVLLSSWIAARELPGQLCWLALESDDNDSPRLIADLLSALQGSGLIDPGGPLEELRAPEGSRTERFLALLVNGLAELRSPVVLVLDEIHELTSPRATATIDFLVRHAPTQLRIVLAGRTDPPLPIERMRVSGALTELRVADLAFDRAETAELCGRLELTLSEVEVGSLWERTEGWVAALQLAALSLRGHPEPARFVAEFTGTDRAIADYLASEVLARLPPERREFVLRTSLVDPVSPELADALTGVDGGTLTLAALEHLGAPVQPVDTEGRAYRYHPLFRELLRTHLRHAHPAEVPVLHRRAARWYSTQGQVMPAIHHALEGEDWEHAGSLIAESWLELFLDGRSAAMRGPMAAIPSEVLAVDPRLAVAFAGSRLQAGDHRDAERYLAIARDAHTEVPAQARESLELAIAAVALYHARLCGHTGDAERFARELTDVARSSSHACWVSLRSFALCNLGTARLWNGEVDRAEADLREALALATEGEREQIVLDCLAQLSIVHLVRGELTRTEELSSQAVLLSERAGSSEGPAVACAYLGSAAVAYLRGELERAEGLLSYAASAAQTAEESVRLATGILSALAMTAAGPRSAAQGALKLGAIRAEIDEGARVPEFLEVVLSDAEPRVLLSAGEPERGRRALERARARRPDSAQLLVCQAGIDLHEGELERAEESLARVLDVKSGEPRSSGDPDTDDSGRMEPHRATLVEAWLLRALVDRAAGEEDAASLALDRALELSEEEPFRDAFLTHGPAVRELLELQARKGTAHPALLEVLLDGVGQSEPVAATLAEPLTERELRILRYLPTMLSNAEIGAEIFVSLNTVKTHLRGIYRKLEVNGRADAVQRARTLGLLPAGIRRPRIVQRRTVQRV